MTKWIIFVQTPYNSVKYISNELNDYSIMSYKRFFEMISTFNPLNPNAFKEALDGFETVLLDCESRNWTIEKRDISEKNYTYQEMLELNSPDEILEEQNKNNTILDRTKLFINEFSKYRVNQNNKKFKDRNKDGNRKK